jgi:hypothetical protein
MEVKTVVLSKEREELSGGPVDCQLRCCHSLNLPTHHRNTHTQNEMGSCLSEASHVQHGLKQSATKPCPLSGLVDVKIEDTQWLSLSLNTQEILPAMNILETPSFTGQKRCKWSPRNSLEERAFFCRPLEDQPPLAAHNRLSVGRECGRTPLASGRSSLQPADPEPWQMLLRVY